MTNNEEKILGCIEDMRELDDYEIEQMPWFDDWRYDTPQIKEVALYIMEKRITEESDYFDKNVPDAYIAPLKKKIEALMNNIMEKIRGETWDQYDAEMEDRIISVLGDHAELFMALPERFRLKTVFEAKEIIGCIEYLDHKYGNRLLGRMKDISKRSHAHGTQRTGNSPKVFELKDGIKELCNGRINIKDKQKKEKIINKIITIVTA